MQRQSLIFGTPATVSTGVSRNTLFRCSAGYWTMWGPHVDCIATNMSGEGQIDFGAMPTAVSCLLKTLFSRTQRWLLYLFWFAGGESLTRFNVRYQERCSGHDRRQESARPPTVCAMLLRLFTATSRARRLRAAEAPHASTLC